MNLRKDIANALYFAVGAVAVGIETLAEAAETLTQKGAVVVKQGKEVFNDFCSKCTVPDDEDPAVTIEEDLEDIPEL